jgi:hypothetical protein
MDVSSQDLTQEQNLFFKNLTQEQLAVVLKNTYDHAYWLMQPEQQKDLNYTDIVSASHKLLRGETIDLSLSDEAAFRQIGSKNLVLSECDISVLPIIADLIVLVGIGIGIEGETSHSAAATIKVLLESQKNQQLLKTIDVMLKGYRKLSDSVAKVRLLYSVIKKIYEAIGTDDFVAAFVSQMTWKNWFVMFVTVAAQLAAFFVTEGGSVIVEFATAVSTLVNLESDIEDMVAACGTISPDEHKHTLKETSGSPPAFYQYNNLFYIVWAGTDKKINVLSTSDLKNFDGGQKITLDYTTDAAPSITSFFGNLYIAWIDNHTHAITYVSWDGKYRSEFSGAIVLPYPYVTALSPAISKFHGLSSNNELITPYEKLVIAWADKSSNCIQVLSSGDGVNWDSSPVSIVDSLYATPSITSTAGKLYIGWIDPQQSYPINSITLAQGSDCYNFRNVRFSAGSDKPVGLSISSDAMHVWLSWQAEDKQIHYMKYSSSDNSQPESKALGNEEANGNPVIAYPFICWTGTNSKHSLNVTWI